MVTTLSSIVVFAFVGPRPVYSRSTWTAEVAIFAEGLWLSCCWSMGHTFSRILGRVSGTTRGRGSVGAPQAALPTAYSSEPVASEVVLSANCAVRGGGGPSICDRPV